MHHYRICARLPLKSWRCEPLSLLTFFAAAKKVSAAPHRGNPNKPQRKENAKNQKIPIQNTRQNKKSHYMNPTLTYWSFLKNRPTIQPNAQRRRTGKAPLPPPKRQKAKKAEQKNRRQKPNHA
jgi:hypothetical protein